MAKALEKETVAAIPELDLNLPLLQKQPIEDATSRNQEKRAETVVTQKESVNDSGKNKRKATNKENAEPIQIERRTTRSSAKKTQL